MLVVMKADDLELLTVEKREQRQVEVSAVLLVAGLACEKVFHLVVPMASAMVELTVTATVEN